MKKVVCLLLVFIFIAGCAESKWRVTPRYGINILVKKNETPRNVEIYLPFPHKNGKPLTKALEVMKEYYKRHHADVPGIEISLKEAKKTMMIHIKIPNINNRRGVSFHTEPRFGFDEPVSLGDPDSRYELKPRFNIKKLSKDRKVSQTWAYFNWEGASSLEFSAIYILNWSRPGFSHPISNGRLAKIGVTSLNPHKDNRPVDYPIFVKITKKGWQKLPVAE